MTAHHILVAGAVAGSVAACAATAGATDLPDETLTTTPLQRSGTGEQ